jgi:hypothetical protein
MKKELPFRDGRHKDKWVGDPMAVGDPQCHYMDSLLRRFNLRPQRYPGELADFLTKEGVSLKEFLKFKGNVRAAKAARLPEIVITGWET